VRAWSFIGRVSKASGPTPALSRRERGKKPSRQRAASIFSTWITRTVPRSTYFLVHDLPLTFTALAVEPFGVGLDLETSEVRAAGGAVADEDPAGGLAADRHHAAGGGCR
jgi:hypothetical protein